MSTIKCTTLQNLSGVEVYTCKAWVNFNGTGTVAIRASGNVSSITDNGVGDYTVNFTTAMPDANYSVQSSRGLLPSGGLVMLNDQFAVQAGSFRVVATNAGNTANTDTPYMFVSVFR